METWCSSTSGADKIVENFQRVNGDMV
jgi:hypothetical protein